MLVPDRALIIFLAINPSCCKYLCDVMLLADAVVERLDFAVRMHNNAQALKVSLAPKDGFAGLTHPRTNTI